MNYISAYNGSFQKMMKISKFSMATSFPKEMPDIPILYIAFVNFMAYSNYIPTVHHLIPQK